MLLIQRRYVRDEGGGSRRRAQSPRDVGVEVKRLSKPGKSWRVLAHHENGKTLNIRNEGDFDEFVLERALHIERMSDSNWWMQLGSLMVSVTLRPNGDVDVRIQGREYLDIGGLVHIAKGSSTRGKRAKAVPNKDGSSGWRKPCRS